MTREDIVRMARQAKLSNEIGAFGYPYLPELERFAAIVASAERERIAKKIEQLPFGDTSASFAIFVREDA